MSDLLVRGGDVLLPDRTLARADILVRGGEIAAVGERFDGDGPVLDATNTIVAPGLVNAHYHSGENFNPGLYENLPLDVWFVHSHQVTRTEPMSADAIYTRTMLGAAQMLRSGTTAVVDFLFEAPEITLETLEPVVRAYRDAGMRATILLGVNDKPFLESLPLRPEERAAAGAEARPPSLERILEVGRAAVERWHEPGGMIGIGWGPSAPQRCTEALMDATMEHARAAGLVWQTHVLETKTQAVTAREWHDGGSFVDALEARGLLGPEATLVHTVWLSERDIALMAERDVAAVHCLLSNLRLGDGIAPLPALMEAGVHVALGTDGRGCVETLDMLELTRMTALVHKARGLHYDAWPEAADVFDLTTRGGSRCAGHGDRLGRIEPGCRADLVLLRRDTPTFTPLHDPLRQIVLGATAADVSGVVVDGRVVVDGGDLVGVDVPALLERASAYAAEELAASAGDPGTVDAVVRAVFERAEAATLDFDSYIGP
ncbi:MAG TPA: amidohydrolase family protein [Solirubrobacteraceae bacterium]|nr:amidohydrolase family protein [Solirubrobacteraceae bacterium]